MSDIGKNPINSFNKTAILLHWVIAFLLMVQFLIGLDMVDIPKGPDSPRPFWFNTHKSIGIILGCLILFRLYWRLAIRSPRESSRHPYVGAHCSKFKSYAFVFLHDPDAYFWIGGFVIFKV